MKVWEQAGIIEMRMLRGRQSTLNLIEKTWRVILLVFLAMIVSHPTPDPSDRTRLDRTIARYQAKSVIPSGDRKGLEPRGLAQV